MRSYISLFFFFAFLLTEMSSEPLIQQREISTRQTSHKIHDNAWPKGLFYGIGDTLYWIISHDRQLLIHTMSEGKISRTRTVDLSNTSDNLRMTDVTSDANHTLLILFSGDDNFVIKFNLNHQNDMRRIAIPAGYAHTIRHVSGLDAFAVLLNQALAILVNEDGDVNRFGPEITHGNNCCTYAAAAVSGDTVVLNVNRGLRLYSGDLEEIIWRENESKGGFIRELASVGDVWVAIDSGFEERADGIRLFLPQGQGYVSYLSPLPMADDSLGMADDEWRVTDCGDKAIVWSRRSDVMFRVTGTIINLFSLDKTTPQGRVCPSHSDRVFLIDQEGYTTIDFD